MSDITITERQQFRMISLGIQVGRLADERGHASRAVALSAFNRQLNIPFNEVLLPCIEV